MIIWIEVNDFEIFTNVLQTWFSRIINYYFLKKSYIFDLTLISSKLWNGFFYTNRYRNI